MSDVASQADHAPIHRLLDANLDRAREGLRVLEDWCRFAVHRHDLVVRLKDLRQRLGQCHRLAYKMARHAGSDSAAGLSHPAQEQRLDPLAVVAANAGRVQEALRVLEEFGRLVDPDLAREAARIRYILYDLEVACLQAGQPAPPPLEADQVTSLDHPLQTKQASSGTRRAMTRRERHDRLADSHLYLITSPAPDLPGVVEAALRAGVRLVQYRPKGQPATDLERFEQASQLRDLCHGYGALFLVNDRVDLALAVDADGVHLGQDDLPPAIARRLLGPDRLIGRSTHALDQLRRAIAEGCDYVGVGPIHETPSKPGRSSVGLAYAAAAAAECPIPWFAIGGIDASNLAEVRAAGADRVALIRAITQAADPFGASADLLRQLEASA
ncbi:MAG: thiamine phosphate synthase [Cyanobacteriota bacterium]|nr:thiamine phosphate synthase [Cyanobacteriota bacterium]